MKLSWPMSMVACVSGLCTAAHAQQQPDASQLQVPAAPQQMEAQPRAESQPQEGPMALHLQPEPLPHASSHVVDLDYALDTAKKHAPELREAAAQTAAARARVGIARSPLLPQVTGSASYTLSETNSVSGTVATTTTGGLIPTGGVGGYMAERGWTNRQQYGASLRGTQLIYDFGQTWNLTEAAKSNAISQEQTEFAEQLTISYNVRTAFLTAGANRALAEVSNATLHNQERHMLQIQGFVDVGTRPPIDLAQAKTDVASARLDLLRAQNNYASAKAQLSRAMGTPNQSDYEVSDALPGAEDSEDAKFEDLVKLAERDRPEFAAMHAQVLAQEANLRSIKGQYAPSLGFTGGIDTGGINKLSNAYATFSVGLGLTWQIFQGGLTNHRVDEGNAELNQLQAQFETLEQDLRLALTQAELSLKAARAALDVADELVQLAKERLTLADGRYQTGVGNIIELGDAELALRDAQTQRVSAAYDLASARALLHRTLGRF